MIVRQPLGHGCLPMPAARAISQVVIFELCAKALSSKEGFGGRVE